MLTKPVTPILHADVKEAPSGLDAYVIADLVGKPYATLMSELSGQPGHKLAANLVLPLMLRTGSDRAMQFFARNLGGVYLASPQPAQSAESLLSGLAVSFKEFGEYAEVAAASIADGIVTASELGRIEKEGYEAVTAITAVILKARGLHQKQYGGRT